MISNKYVLGLTGGIGTGKTTAAEYLTSRGFIHVDADQIGRDITVKGSPVLQLLRDAFGEEIFMEDGSLHRKKLASIVFSDPDQKKKMDDIMFAEIGRIIRERISLAKGPVLLDAPLLYESGLDCLCDEVILITCDIETRLERVASRDGAGREEVLARIRNQMSDEEKSGKADHIVDNSGGLEELYNKLDKILSLIVDKVNE